MSMRFDIFARKEHPEPLVYIGSVEVDTVDQVAAASLAEYGLETDWIEMLAIPHREMVTVFSEQQENQ